MPYEDHSWEQLLFRFLIVAVAVMEVLRSQT